MIFKFMPTAPIAWRDVWIGAAVTAVLFEVGKALIGLYLGKSGMTQSFQAAGSIVVLLAWVYYAAQIFLLGAEFTKVYADAHGSVAGTRALAATHHAAAVAKAGTDGAPPAPLQANRDALARTAEAQREVGERLELATQALARQVVAFALATLATGLLSRWQKRRRLQQRRLRH
jgi:membrane protein